MWGCCEALARGLGVTSQVPRQGRTGGVMGEVEAAIRKMYETKMQQLLDVIAAQDKLIKEYQELIELLRKVST